MAQPAHAHAGQFNPLDAARRLKAAGCDPAVADAVAGEFVIALSGLATKADLDAQDARLDIRLNAQDERLDARLEGLEGRVDAKLSTAVNRMIVAQLVIAGLLFTAIQLADRLSN